MPASPHPSDPHKAAKQLLKELRIGDAGAIQRARKVFFDLAGVADADMPSRMGLQRCQHVIAKERGANNWTSLKDNRLFQVVGIIGTVDLELLRQAAEREPETALVRRMMKDIFEDPNGCRAVGTRKECEELIAWSLRVHPEARRKPARLGPILRMEPFKNPDNDADDGDERNMIMDYLEPNDG